MPTQTLLTPRKSPIQARSTASVEAIREATVQILLAIGKQRLTTARVAQRAGVSIGTLYQYFPNKSALLHHALKHHLDSILALVEQVCRQQRGQPLEAMVTVLISSFLEAKLRNPALGTAFYAVAADLGGHSILQANEARTNAALSAMLASAPQPLTRDPAIVASMMQGAMAGVSRRMLEIASTPAHTQALREELVSSMRPYVQSYTNPRSLPLHTTSSPTRLRGREIFPQLLHTEINSASRPHQRNNLLVTPALHPQRFHLIADHPHKSLQRKHLRPQPRGLTQSSQRLQRLIQPVELLFAHRSSSRIRIP